MQVDDVELQNQHPLRADGLRQDTPPKRWPAASTSVRIADATALTEAGRR
jgi:hypothetical protein